MQKKSYIFKSNSSDVGNFLHTILSDFFNQSESALYPKLSFYLIFKPLRHCLEEVPVLWFIDEIKIVNIHENKKMERAGHTTRAYIRGTGLLYILVQCSSVSYGVRCSKWMPYRSKITPLSPHTSTSPKNKKKI